MAAETESGFLIDGVLYEVPTLDTFDLDDAQVLYDYTGLAVEDFLVQPESEDETREMAQRFKNPGLIRALVHIAYQRKHPKMPAAQVRKIIGKVNQFEALMAFVGQNPEEAPNESPLASTSEPAGSSQSGPLDNESSTPPTNGSGGSDSENVSDLPAAVLARTTASRSATSSTLDRGISAA